MDSAFHYGSHLTGINSPGVPQTADTMVEEELSRGILRLIMGRSKYFASRILQDIQEILSDKTQQAYDELLDIKASVKVKVDIEEEESSRSLAGISGKPSQK